LNVVVAGGQESFTVNVQLNAIACHPHSHRVPFEVGHGSHPDWNQRSQPRLIEVPGQHHHIFRGVNRPGIAANRRQVTGVQEHIIFGVGGLNHPDATVQAIVDPQSTLIAQGYKCPVISGVDVQHMVAVHAAADSLCRLDLPHLVQRILLEVFAEQCLPNLGRYRDS
jgi:hypothetical protein